MLNRSIPTPVGWEVCDSSKQIQPSEIDIKKLKEIRANIQSFLTSIATLINTRSERSLVLDVAPQTWGGIAPLLDSSIAKCETLDLNPASGATFIQDLTAELSVKLHSRYDFVVCTEVIEHTLNPFLAVRNLGRMLKPGGLLYSTVPFNFRIHGPLPDCWRISEHGIRALLSDAGLSEIVIMQVTDQDRSLMPTSYAFVASQHGNGR